MSPAAKQNNIAILVGAGSGERMGFKEKAFLSINGIPTLIRSVLPFVKSRFVDRIIIVVKENKIGLAKSIIKKYKLGKIQKIIKGGTERQDSVYNALKTIKEANYILVHDIARPLVTTQLINSCIKCAIKYGAAIPAIQVRDTIKIGSGFVQKTLDRKSLWAVQTPQVFKYGILKRAYKKAGQDKFYGTDDASLVERLGQKIKIVPGDPKNIKVTLLSDLVIIEGFFNLGLRKLEE